jgi:hypothetical protein
MRHGKMSELKIISFDSDTVEVKNVDPIPQASQSHKLMIKSLEGKMPC